MPAEISRESTEELPVRRSELAEAIHVDERGQARARARLHERLFGEPEDRAFGRYRLIEVVGRGGMGTVWRAHDGKLGREVALKLLHEGALRRPLRAKRQLEAEAKLMAQLDHPNVVRVYDVGEHEGELYLAMELVRGKTLRRWQDEDRDWRAVLAAYLDAGAGLAAAHHASLVHGDFKPDNVLIGDEGRVRVTDFAMTRHFLEARLELELSRADADTPAAESGGDETHAGSASSSLHLPLVRGTPAYMAPEQFEGKIADARSDQFSFCVAVWEALAGRRPFFGRSWGQLREAIDRGPEAPEQRVGPRALWAALERGLKVAPSERWATLDELLAALRSVLQPRRTLGVAGLGVGLVGLGFVAASVGGEAGPPSTLAPLVQHCDPGEVGAELATIWSQPERDQIHEAFVATELPHAEAAAKQAIVQLDLWADAWTKARSEACTSDDAERARLSLVCLDRSQVNFATLVSVLGESNPTTVDVAGELIEGLPSVDSCAHYQLPTGDQARDGAELAAREALAAKHMRLEILWTVGRVDEAIVLADELMREAELRSAPDFVAQAQLYRGLLRLDTGEHELAVDELLRAALRAREAELPELEAEAWMAMADAEARVGGSGAQRWLEISALPLARVDSPTLEFEFANHRGLVARAQGKPSEALEWFERAYARLDEGDEDRPQRRTKALFNLAVALVELGELERALTLMKDSIALAEQIWPPGFPELGILYNGLAGAEKQLGQVEAAYADYQRAQALLREAFGPDHLFVRTVEYQLALCEAELDRCDAGRRRLDDLLVVLRDDPNATMLLPNALAWRSLLCGAPEPGSRALADEALERAKQAMPPGSLPLAKIESHRAWVVLALGDAEAAEQGFLAARPALEAELPEDHLDRVAALGGLGIAWVELGRGDEARPLLEAALAGLGERRPERSKQIRAALDQLDPT